jgi:hypothetical protein
VGWLVHETKNEVQIAQEWYEERDMVKGLFTIPKAVVRKKIYLKEADNSDPRNASNK